MSPNLRALAILGLIALGLNLVGCTPKRDYWADLAQGVKQRQ